MSDIRLRYDADQVRERTDLLALIGQHVTLKKRGGRHVGLCPFHQEKTPSFGVDPEKGFWHCFGCGKGGDAFTFVMEMERLTFPEAVERLAERAGIHPIEMSEPMSQRKEERDLLFGVNTAAATAFGKALRGKAGEAARQYLAGRGITLEQAERFGLGYAPQGWDALLTYLRKCGFPPETVEKAGLALAKSSGRGHIDRFRHRLMIPIRDRQGRVVAFGGRALAKEDNPKYLNTAETPIFHKSRMVYALNWAAEGIGKRGRAIVTEGYFDVIACHLAGFTEAVATLGTALGDEHVQLLRRLAERIYLVFDGDSAGLHAALRSQALFRAAEVDVRIVRLPAEHDPDTLLRELGTAAFERCLDEALSPVEFELDQLVQENPARDAEGRLRLFRAAAKVLHPLSKLDRAEYALRFIDRSLGARGDITELQQALLSEVASLDRASRRPGALSPAAPSGEVPLEREVLTLMIQHPEVAERAVTLIVPEAFTHAGYRDIFHELLNQVHAGQQPDIRRIITEDQQIAAIIAALAVRDSLPLDGQSEQLLQRLMDEYEFSRDKQERGITAEHSDKVIAQRMGEHEGDAPPDPSDAEAVRAWMMRMRKRSQETARRIFGPPE